MMSFAVTVKLICVFIYAYADCWFSHEEAHLFDSFRDLISLSSAQHSLEISSS